MIGRNGTSTGRRSSYTTTTTAQVSVTRNNAAWTADAVGIHYNTILSIASTSLGTRAQRLVKTKGLGNVKLVGSKQFLRATEDAQD